MASVGEMFPSGAPGLADNLSIRGSTEKLSPSAVNRIMMEFLMYFGRALLIFYPVYLTGYMGLSISWVVLCMVMVTWWKKNRQWKDARIGGAIHFLDNETSVVNKELHSALQMASWVHFPDFEKVEWLNKVLEQAWPFFGMYMEKLLKENIQPAIRLSSSALKMFTFTKVHFGHLPLKITGMKAYTDEVDHREVVLDLNICYESDVDIDAEVQPPIKAGVKGLKLQGMMRVILEPLIGQAPLIGGVTFFFIRRPTLQINWTGMTNLLDSPGFSSLSEGTIMDIIASLMVLPNRMCIPLIDQVKVDQMRFPLPRGVVRVHLLEARDLVAKDTYMMGLVKGKSDPYATLRVGNRQVKSKTVKENLQPRWNEVYEFVIHEAPGQELELEMYDEDTDKDDSLGTFNLDFGEVKKKIEMDQWFPLEGVQNGEVHLKLQWFSLKSDPELLRESSDGLACAMLAVYLDNASNLPKDHSEMTEHQKHKKPAKEARLTKRAATLNSYVEFAIDKDVKKSKVAYASKDPKWEEGFTFFVHNVKTQQLMIQVKEHEKKTQLGIFNLPLTRLLNTSDMTLDQRFVLERSGANSQIQLKATLRILTVEKPPPTIILNPPPQDKKQIPQTNQGGKAPASTPAVDTSSSAALSPNTNPTSTPSTASLDTQSGSDEILRPPPSTPNMRRYDSQSMLSDNSIASSRFDLSDGASYPEAISKHQGSFGEIQLTVRYASLRNKLIVLELIPHQFEFDVSLQEAQTRKLDVSVKNGKMFHSRERKTLAWYELTLPDLKKLS
ncbi:Extended synaptotagmin-3 [Dissostichus eleginoides]|uniref:Extended synaptotagmin-3 n=1 Tax=Dissostichus eleginoides TaxID=100907 RepID=A0AAD9CK69_DISEL|nr:Extended synaptotagmin-3 [Dissostichus eleginoides]